VLQVVTDAAPGTTVRIAIRPEDVILALPRELEHATSARNALAGVVTRVTITESDARVVVDCGFALVARVTPRSIEELGLAEGVRIAAIFKATSPHVIPTCQTG
jgi:molybdopterin-binding protein